MLELRNAPFKVLHVGYEMDKKSRISKGKRYSLITGKQFHVYVDAYG